LRLQGETNRAIAEHTLNKNSSRSHCIFTIYIESRFRDGKSIHSKINLIDLAGSERLSKTGVSNRGNISVCGEESRNERGGGSPPQQNSAWGNCNTVLVANICGEAVHVEETLSSLRFATRMKWVTTEPVINETHDREDTVKALEKEIILLKQELAMRDSLVNGSSVTYDPLSDIQIAEIKAQVHKYLQGAVEEIDVVNIRQVQEVFKQFKLIVSQQEREVEARLRSKYLLIDKNDSAAVAAVQKAGVVDADGHLVREEDGQDLGTRTAPFSSGCGGMKKSRKSNEQPKRLAQRAPQSIKIPSTNLTYGHPYDLCHAAGWNKLTSPCLFCGSSPLSRPEAFEQFKEECGSEINQIFKENKSILLARKKRSNTVAQRINFIKREMEDIQKALEAQKQERWQQGEYDEKGQIIIDEKEILLILKLKDLKEEYRSGCAELQDLKAEIQYCQHLVDQCRNKLISEFEIWYRESFLIPKEVQEALKPGGNIRPGMIPINGVMCL
ncbi:KIF9 protein, partial [Nyctibius bracteatus]|nr:KIF9 protein [Nyctibius bracteatus]